MKNSLLPTLLLILVVVDPSDGGDWVNISGTLTWNRAEELPERPSIDVPHFTSQVRKATAEVRGLGWVVDAKSLGVANVVIFVKGPKRVHPAFPQSACDTKDAFSTFFESISGQPPGNVHRLSDLRSESALDPVPSLVRLTNFEFQPCTLALRAGQPVVVVNKDSVRYNLMFYGSRNASEICEPNQVALHCFSSWTRNWVGCTIHSWMVLPVAVFDHPYFDTTNGEGRFCISRVPAGEIELCALFWKYSIDLRSGEINFADLGDQCLKLTAESDIDLGRISIQGWPLIDNRRESKGVK